MSWRQTKSKVYPWQFPYKLFKLKLKKKCLNYCCFLSSASETVRDAKASKLEFNNSCRAALKENQLIAYYWNLRICWFFAGLKLTENNRIGWKILMHIFCEIYGMDYVNERISSLLNFFIHLFLTWWPDNRTKYLAFAPSIPTGQKR